nr:hypothetical protein V992_03722 [Mycobacterium tuberculosis TB_RSA82]
MCGQLEPVEPVSWQRQQIGHLADAWKLHVPGLAAFVPYSDAGSKSHPTSTW